MLNLLHFLFFAHKCPNEDSFPTSSFALQRAIHVFFLNIFIFQKSCPLKSSNNFYRGMMAKKAAMRGFWIQETDEVGWMIFRVSGKREGFSGNRKKKELRLD